MNSLWKSAWAVTLKDFRSEWRSRSTLSAVALFSLTAPVALGYALSNLKVIPEVMGGLLWTVLFFAAMVGLPRAFVKEEETGTAVLLRLHYPADAVLWGKSLAQFALLLSTQLAAVPIFLLLLKAEVTQPLTLLWCLILGDIGLAVSSCVLGAIASQSRSKGALFPALAAPLLLPVLSSLSVGSGIAFGSGGDATAVLKIVAAFDVAIIAASALLFEFVWD